LNRRPLGPQPQDTDALCGPPRPWRSIGPRRWDYLDVLDVAAGTSRDTNDGIISAWPDGEDHHVVLEPAVRAGDGIRAKSVGQLRKRGLGK
jgi:hypothetical protein